MTNALAPMGVTPRGFLDEARFRQWLLEKSDASQGDWQCVVFNLVHKDNHSNVVTSYRIKKDLDSQQRETEVAKLITEFKETAQGIADLGGSSIQGFIVGGHRSLERDEPSTYQFHFNLRSNPGAIPSVNETDSSDTRGMIGQFMRMLEAMAVETNQNNQRQNALMFEQLQITSKQNLELHAHLLNYRITMEDLADRKDERARAAKKDERDGIIGERITNVLLSVGEQALVGAMKKNGVISDGGKVNVDNLRVMVENLTPQQMAEFIKSLSPQQTQLFEPLLAPILLSMPDKMQEIQALNTEKKDNDQ